MSQLENASRSLIEAHQLARLQLGLTRILPHNGFYEKKLLTGRPSIIMENLEDLSRLPFTTNQEFVPDQEAHPPFGTNLTYPRAKNKRLPQTPGTPGGPSLVFHNRE